MPAAPRQPGPPALELIESAAHLLRRTPAVDYLIWFAGSAPFTAALLFFWAEMSRAAFAESRLFTGAWSLALLFVWLKTCQSVFAARLLARASASEDAPWTFRRWLRVFTVQAVLQPASLFVLPVALLITLPFGWMFALGQNIGVLADRAEGRPGECLRLAWRQCLLWPGQNHVLISLLTVAWLVAALNAGIATYALPHLLKMLLGLESRLTLTPMALLNSTFVAVAVALGALAVDPLVKAAYALRCLHGESRHTGADLRARLLWLRRLAPLVLLGVLLTGGSPLLGAEPAAPAPPGSAIPRAQLDHAITDVLDGLDFTWRAPRDWQLEHPTLELSWFARQMKAIDEGLERFTRALEAPIKKFFSWLDQVFSRKGPKTPTPNVSLNVAAFVEFLMWLLVVIVAAILVWFAFRLWRPRRPAAEAVVTAPALPDLRAEFVAADQLPEDGWLALANRLLEEGDLRLALRAFYLAALAHLARREFIRLAKFKSNRDYEGELRRRARARPEVVAAFAGAVREFDRVWYGCHELDSPGLVSFAAQVEELCRA